MIERWIDPYYATRKSSRRGRLSVEYEIHFERNLVRLVSSIENQTYTPTTYAFITWRPRQREVFACDMNLRIIDRRLADATNPIVERKLTDRTFNNRVGYGNVKAINSLISDIYEVSHGYTEDAWVIKIDMMGYFPNAIHQVAYDNMRGILDEYAGEDKDALGYLLRLSMFTDATRNCKRLGDISDWDGYPDYKSLFKKPYGIGGIIGRERWQTAMNLYLNDLDHKAIEEWGLHWNRFVDDIAIVTDNKEAALAWIPEIRKELAKVGVCMHPKKFYCQHYSRGAEFIGATIKSRRVYANNKTINNARIAIAGWNGKVCADSLESMISSINSYLGIFKGRNEHNTVTELLSGMNEEWFHYCIYDEHKMCLRAKGGYKHYQLLGKMYNLKLKNNGHKRKSRKIGSREIGLC